MNLFQTLSLVMANDIYNYQVMNNEYVISYVKRAIISFVYLHS